MASSVRIEGLGLVTSLGLGCERNIKGMGRGQGQYQSLQLTQFEPPLCLPYLAVPDNPGGAGARFARLIDTAVIEALDGCPLTPEQRRQMPIFIGSSCYGIALAEECYQRELDADDAEALPIPIDGFSHIGASLRRRFDLLGPDFAFNTACTAGANALLSAARCIRFGHSSHALVIGLETFNVTSLAGFHGMQLLSQEVMRPFDRRRSGLVLGEGCGVVLLAEGDDCRPGIYLGGGASRCDNYSISASNPNGAQIAAVMQAALEDAGVTAADIRAIKAHGTASPLNDDGEAAGMKRVFGELPPFFALKSTIGHTLGACGVIESAMVALALQRGFIPATAGFEQADPELGVTPLAAAMVAEKGHYMLNYFGYGGNNNSLIMHYR